MIIKSWLRKDNFGDLLNKDLIFLMTGIVPDVRPANIPVVGEGYLIIGSVLAYIDAGTIVWGTGFCFSEDKIINKPKKVCAVRGPLSRDRLLKLGVDCPEIYGDPALLMPLYYKPNVKKNYKLGVVTHWGNTDEFEKCYSELLKGKTVVHIRHDLETKDFIDKVNSCEKIISSSLHGIIIADAYGIPAIQAGFVEASESGQFKFNDYFLSVHRPIVKPLLMNPHLVTDNLLTAFYDYEVDIDLDKLLDACPFKNRVIISPYARKLRNSDEANAKNYPYFKEVVEKLSSSGFYLVQIGKTGESKIEGVNEFLVELSLKQIQILIEKSATWISVDNFMQHYGWMLNKKGIAIFGPSDPVVFGHDSNVNLLKDRNYLRKDPFFPWESVKFNADAFVSPEVVVNEVKNLM